MLTLLLVVSHHLSIVRQNMVASCSISRKLLFPGNNLPESAGELPALKN